MSSVFDEGLQMSEHAASKLMRLHAFALDVVATRQALQETLVGATRDAADAEFSQQVSSAMVENLRGQLSAKSAFLHEAVEAFTSWGRLAGLAPDDLTCIASLSGEPTVGTAAVLRTYGTALGDGGLIPVLLEAVTSTDWPESCDWVVPKLRALAATTVDLSPTLNEQAAMSLLNDLETRHRRAKRRLRRDSMAPGTQATYGAFIAGAAILTHGASEAIGTAIGTHVLGYSGAAATSAGLAWLGGGSLAAGGFGMAGGSLLAGTAVWGTKSLANKAVLGLLVAKSSRAIFIDELAKLDVRCAVEPRTAPSIIDGLGELERSLRKEWDSIRPEPGIRRNRLLGLMKQALDEPASVVDSAREAKEILPAREERELAASVRALEYELRYLESPEWKRAAAAVPRFMGVPAAQKLVDKLEVYATDFADGIKDGRLAREFDPK